MRRLTLALWALAAAGPALAQDDQGWKPSPQMQAQRAHLREVCSADMERICPDAAQDRRARRQCMVDNRARFSKPCQDALAEMDAHRAARRAEHDQSNPQ
jgi:hypothetical protein